MARVRQNTGSARRHIQASLIRFDERFFEPENYENTRAAKPARACRMTTELPSPARPAAKAVRVPDFSGSAFGYPREFFDNRFVYAVVSPRARGLSIGINMNPDKRCNFNCEYCEVNRLLPARETFLDVNVMAEELQRTLTLADSGELKNFRLYRNTPADLMQLRHVALSGDGEPTLCPNFLDAVRAIVHVRARRRFFKIVLLTNASGLDLRDAQDGLKLFTPDDEIWAKLDAGTQNRMNAVNHPDRPLDKILENILFIARQRPVIIQSLFPLLNGEEPSAQEFHQYAQRLCDLKQAGAQISLVQIYSATRPTMYSTCGHLPLKVLARIAQYVRETTGLKAEVF
jgi:wyosine [tRNA(Phe)-imidazoG37] synthetase (radical SAM superfamily)